MSSTNSWNFYRGMMDRAGVDKINYLNYADRSMCLTQAKIEVRLKKEKKEWDEKYACVPCGEVPLPHIYGEPIQIINQKHPTEWDTLQNTVPTPTGFQNHIVTGAPINVDNPFPAPIIMDEAVDPETLKEIEEKLREQIMKPIMPKRRSIYDMQYELNDIKEEEELDE